jgi:hypothetical protein
MDWSTELQDLTLSTLNKGDLTAFVCGRVCHLKHRDGRFGILSMLNAADRHWLVNVNDGNEETYETLERMIQNGWVID